MADGSAPARSLRVEFDGDLRKLESSIDAADAKLKGFSGRASNDLGKVETRAEGAAEAIDELAAATTRGAAADDRARDSRGRLVSMTERMANEAAKAVGQAAVYERQMRAGAAAMSAQGLAQERAFQASERLAAGWRGLSAQGAAQARVLENLRAANDNTATTFSAQATQIGTLIPGFGRLTALVGGLSAALLAAQFVQTVTQFQAIDASLKAATGSTEGAQSAMAFVRAESDRLGLSLGSTAKDFASFAAATRGTELEGQKTRAIFSAVAEAGTVLGLSAETMSGALNALTQIASKGVVQAEELRGQLGDRLPGALNIAARAMGVTTAEFNKMLEQGQVIAADFLPKFADELHRTFGPEAANASNNLRANINRLQTAITDLYLAAGQGGLTDALNDATRQATAFLKASQDTATGVGATLATGLRSAGTAFEFLRRNSDLAGAGLAALIALRFGPAVVEIAVGIGRAIAAMGVYDVATKSLAVSQTAAVASSRALSLALSAFGGPVGIAITAVAAGVAYLALRQDEGVKAAEAQAAGLKTLDAALAASKGSLASAADETKRLAAEQLTAAQAAVTAAEMRLRAAEADQARARAQSGGGGVDAGFYDSLSTGVADREAARAAEVLKDAKEQAAAMIRYFTGVATDADRALLKLGASTSSVSASLDAAIPSMQKYADAMSKLIAMVPQLQQAVDAQAKLGAAKSALDTALASAGDAHLKGEISFKEMAERGAKARDTYKLATEEVTGYAAASKKLQSEERGAAIAGMEARSGAIAKLRDDHAALVQSYKEGANAQMTEAQRTELVGRAEGVLAQKIANTNKQYDERAAKKASAGSGADAYDTAFQRSKDQVEEMKLQADSAGRATEEIIRLAEANRLRRAAVSAGRTIDADLARDIDEQAAAFGRQRKATDDAVEGHRLLEESTRALGQDFASFFEDVALGGRGMTEAFGGLARSLGSSGLQALLTGSGPLAGMFGTASSEKGGVGGLMGGILPDFEKAVRKGAEAGTEAGSSVGVSSSLTDIFGKNGAGIARGAMGALAIGSSYGAGAASSSGTQALLSGAMSGAVGGAMLGAELGAGLGPAGAVAGAALGSIISWLGFDDASNKRKKQQMKQYKDEYEQNLPQITQFRAGLRGEATTGIENTIKQVFQQYVEAARAAAKAGDMAAASEMDKEFVSFVERTRSNFISGFEGLLKDLQSGLGPSGPFAQANAAVVQLGEALKAFVSDAQSLPEAEKNSARARAAAQQAALGALDAPKQLSDTQRRLAEIGGTAAALGEILRALGMSADEAATAIASRTNKALADLRAEFSADLDTKINSAKGQDYKNEIGDLVKERNGLLADARAIGTGTGKVGEYFRLSAQKIIDGSELTGDAFNALVRQFPELRGQVHAFSEAIDTAAAKAAAAGRKLGYDDRAFSAGIDTSTQAGALAAFDRSALRQRAEEAKAGGRAMAALENALASERAAIIRNFAAQAAETERLAAEERKRAAEAGAERVRTAEDRLFDARTDTATKVGALAAYDRRAAQERTEEVKAGGQALKALERAQAAERLGIIKQFAEQAAEAERQAAEAATARASGYRERLWAARGDADTRAGALAIFDLKANQERAAEAEAGGQAMARLEKTLAAERLKIIADFAERATETERQAREAAAARGEGYLERLWTARGDRQTQSGALAIFDRQAGQQRAAEVAAGGQQIARLEKTLAAERASIIRDFAERAAAAEQAIADRRRSYQDELFAATTDTSTKAGALAAFDRQAAQRRADEAKAGGQAMADLERTLAAQRTAIIRDFAEKAKEAERATAEALASRRLSYQDRAFAATTDTSTRTGALAAFDRRAAQERVAEAAAGGKGMKDLEHTLALERLAILRDFAEQAKAAEQAAAEDIAARRLSAQDRLFAATTDTSTRAGALAAFDRQAARDRADEVAKGGQALKTLEAAIAADRLNILKDFAEQAKVAEEERTRAADEVMARKMGFWDRAFAAAVDTSTLTGALAAFDRAADHERAAEAKAGGEARAGLELALSRERANIIKQFADQAAEVEKQAAARRLSAEDRLFAARTDTATLTGQLAAYDRRAAQERLEETEAGGQAMTKLLAAQEAERLQIIKDAGTEAKTFLLGTFKTIRDYLNSLKTGADTALSPGERLKAARVEFDRQVALARSGDRDALGSITQTASTLLEAGKAMYASGQGYQDILASVTRLLDGLTKEVTSDRVIARANGGWVNGPGTATSDSVAARLSNGEFVVNAASARLNADLLAAMNDNRLAAMPAAVPMPVPVLGGGMDVGALLAELQALRGEVRTLRAENKAGQEMQARVTKAGADKVAGKVEETTDEVAGSREDARRDAPMRAGRGAPVRAA